MTDGKPKLGIVSRTYRKLFPESALKRMKHGLAMRQLERLSERTGTFDATNGSRTQYDFVLSHGSPDTAIAGDAEALRKQVRQLEFNNGQVAGAIKRIRNNVVGKGFRLQSTVKADPPYARQESPRITDSTAEQINYQSEKYFGIWNKEADLQLLKMFHEICGLAEMDLIRTGEAIVVARQSKRPGRVIPYCLQGYEIDRLGTPPKRMNDPNVRHGIEYDSEGVPKTYFVLKSHPGETLFNALKRFEFEEIPAYFDNGRQKVFHLYDPIRFEQSRGFSELASGLKSLQQADRIKEAEMFATLMAACTVMTYKSGNPTGAVTGLPNTDANNNKLFEFSPGAQFNLTDDEEIEFNNPNRPNNSIVDFLDALMKDPSGALDVPPEVLTQNWKGMNYSNARTVLLQFYLTCAIRQFFLINHLCDPVYEGVFYSLIANGRMRIAGFESRPWDFMRHTWIPNGWQWVDPEKESNAAENDVINMFNDPYSINAGKGQDADEVLEKNARFLKKKKDLEAQYGIEFPSKTEPKTLAADQGGKTGE